MAGAEFFGYRWAQHLVRAQPDKVEGVPAWFAVSGYFNDVGEAHGVLTRIVETGDVGVREVLDDGKWLR